MYNDDLCVKRVYRESGGYRLFRAELTSCPWARPCGGLVGVVGVRVRVHLWPWAPLVAAIRHVELELAFGILGVADAQVIAVVADRHAGGA